MACMEVCNKLSPTLLTNNIMSIIAVEGGLSLLSSMLYVDV